MSDPAFVMETNAALPVKAKDLQLIPLAQSVRIGLPGLPAGLIWNRPTAVIVQDDMGEQQVLPIQDVTRNLQLLLLGLGLVGSLMIWLVFGRGR